MMEHIVSRIRGSILTPVDNFRSAREEVLLTTFPYLLFVALIHAILASLVSLFFLPGIPLIDRIGGEIGTGTLIATIILLFTAGIVLTIMWGLWLHIWVYTAGGRNGLLATFKAAIYGSTPFFLLGWVPVVGLGTAFWSAILQVIGIREMHSILLGKSVLTYILASVLIIILATILVGWAWISALSYGSVVPVRT